ncbi:MAG: protein-L-isoaspartate O-methyltransferase [Armatimonadota bacterium]|nr:MAG: protein-L-isoaspartate O-methyltransferase [Armatimonadota bacterium]
MTGSTSPGRQKEIERLIAESLIPRGVTEPAVLHAFRSVPRELFVPPEQAYRAYENSALPIGHGQTISQPLMIGIMLQALEALPGQKVLEVGTGSGYQAALLARMGLKVFTVERIPALAEAARSRLEALGLQDVVVIVADGSRGLPELAPFDRIIVACAAPDIPGALAGQLTEGGILVAPVGSRFSQRLCVARRQQGELSVEYGDECVFVPLIGQQGWPEEEIWPE